MKLSIFELRGLNEIVIEKFLKENNYLPFAIADYYNNDGTKYVVQYRLDSIIIQSIEVVYDKASHTCEGFLFC